MTHIARDSDLPTGPFSGVNLSCLLKATTIVSHAILEADGRELEQYASGMSF